MRKRKSGKRPIQKTGCEEPRTIPASQLDVDDYICRDGKRVKVIRIGSTREGCLRIWTDDKEDITVDPSERIPVPT